MFGSVLGQVARYPLRRDVVVGQAPDAVPVVAIEIHQLCEEDGTGDIQMGLQRPKQTCWVT